MIRIHAYGLCRGTDSVVHSDYTQLIVARDPQNLRYDYKSYAVQTIRMADMKQLDLGSKDIKM